MAEHYDAALKARRKTVADAYFASLGVDTSGCTSLAEVFETFPELAVRRDEHRQALQTLWAAEELTVE